jgi:hypothetical protein
VRIAVPTLPVLVIVLCFSVGHAADRYNHFRATIYARAYEVEKMDDLAWLKESFDVMDKHLKIDKIYLESHRDLLIVPSKTLNKVKKFFADRGVETASGITFTIDESNRFQTFCYSKPEDRQKVKEIIEHTARHFDEFILDDFFFTSCKCEVCIAAKGDRSWTDYRLELMTGAAQDLVLKPAKAVNPKVKVVIKYPNWYEHFQGLGFNLETEPPLFDGIYTGTETRDAVLSNQHLQPYLGYLIFRYFENIKPGGNGGGWVDTGGMRYADRYAEQLWLTLFAKAPEMTLFDFRQMERPIQESHRAEWHGTDTSFDFDTMIAPEKKADGAWTDHARISLVAGYALDQIDPVIGQLGTPVGLKSYKPFHSTGEDFLHNYIGMIGVPMDLVPAFPADANTILLAETARFDPQIVEKIKGQLVNGKTVIITSGLLKALEGKGIEDIVELKVTERKAMVTDFKAGFQVEKSAKPIVFPQIQYLTNDSWEQVSVLDGPNGWPIFHDADYASGHLYVLIIPDNFADLYHVPPESLKRIKQTLMQDIYVRVDGPTSISLFVYDNETFVIQSFRDQTEDIRVVIDPKVTKLRDLVSGEELPASEKLTSRRFWGRQIGEDKSAFDTGIEAHSYRAFRVVR